LNDNFNAVNDAQGMTVESPNTEPMESAAVETSVDAAQEVATPAVGEEKPSAVQTPEQNAWYAEQRRAASEAKAEADKAKAAAARLQSVLNKYGYQGSPEEIADQVEAQEQKITVEQLRAVREQEAKRIREAAMNDPEIRKLKEERDALYEMQLDQIRKGDLEKVKKAFPDVAAKDVKELGEQFASLRANGIDAVVAYAAIKQAEGATKPKTPPSIGSVNNATARVKDFYTPEEVDSLSDAQLNDPAVWAAVRKSMTSPAWRK
jgi:SOS-response transcriptional repressor LexA